MYTGEDYVNKKISYDDLECWDSEDDVDFDDNSKAKR